MAIRLRVRRNTQIVVPVRFTRAIEGPTDPAAPEVDDRGFAMGTRPSGWSSSDARGAMVSIQEGDTIRLKVLREDIDSSADLYVSSTNPDVAAIVGSAIVGADGIFQVKGVKSASSAPVKIQVSLGFIGGPVLGELEPHVFQAIRLRVRAHLVSINPPAADASTARDANSLSDLFRAVNRIWRAAGIEFLYDPAETRPASVTGYAVDGTMTTNMHGKDPANPKPLHDIGEFVSILNMTNPAPDPNAINIFFVRAANEDIGLTFDHDHPRPPQGGGFGVVLTDKGSAHDLAHELGHYLDSDVHSGETTSGTPVRDDIVSERRLMYGFADLPQSNPPFRRNVGYGAGVPGNLITVKKLDPDPSDGELARNRLRALSPN